MIFKFLLTGLIMKTLLLLLLFSFGICQAQVIPYKANISVSKEQIKSNEEFTVTYSLTDVQGYVYIGVKDGYFETIGNDRWEGEIKEGETKTVTFTVKLKDSSKKWIQSKVPLLVGFSYRPFDKRISGGQYEQINIEIADFDVIRNSVTANLIKGKNVKKVNSISSVTLYPSTYSGLPFSNTFTVDATIPKQEYYSLKTNTSLNAANEYIDSKVDRNIEKKGSETFNKASELSTNSVTLQFYAASMSFRNTQSQQLPWQYFTVEILGKQTQNDQYPVVLEQQTIGSSSTGSFTISTTQDYPYYQLVILVESSRYLALRPPDSWNGKSSISQLTEFGIMYETVAKPSSNIQYNISDPDIGGNSELQKVLNMSMDYLQQGYTFASNNSANAPDAVILFFNETITNSQIGASFTMAGRLGSTNYPTIYIQNEAWDKRNTVLHEYGHAIQLMRVGGFPPESGGTHILGVRYNPQLAFSEGWGHFFAAAATSNPGIDPDFNLSSNPPYSTTLYNFHNYSPSTQFEGNCDEVMVASMLWEMYTQTGNHYNYMQSALGLTLGTGHKPYNIFEFIKAHRLYVNTSNGTSYWIRAGQNLKIGLGINFVTSGNSIQNAINSASDKYIVYVSQGTYNEDISISNKNIALFGEAPVNTFIRSPNGNSTDVIALTNSSSEYNMINGFSIQYGNNAINVSSGAKAYISGNIIQSNNNGVSTKGDVILKNNSIRENGADGFLVPTQSSSPTIRLYNNVFDNNQSAIHFYDTQNNMHGSVLSNLITNNTNGIIAASSSTANPVDFISNGFYKNGTNFSNVSSDGGDVTADPQYAGFFIPQNDYLFDSGFNPSSGSSYYEFIDRTSTTFKPGSSSNTNMIGLYGGPEGFRVNSDNLPSIPTGIEDGIYISEDLTHYDINHLYVGYIHRTFVDVAPYGDYIVSWDNWQIRASYGCGDILLYDGSGAFQLPSLPDGYPWERDGNGYVIGTLSTGGTDNDGFHHTASLPIKISSVPNTFITSGTLTTDTYWCGTISLTGSITVPSGITLTVNPGTVVKFPSGASLIVNGKLNALGCTFTSQSGTSPQSWGSIQLNGSGASGSTIKYATILYGNEVQFINVPGFEISNCNLTDDYIPIYVSGSSGTISGNYITSTSIGHAIEIENASSVNCRKNVIVKSNHRGSGIQYGGGSNGYIWQNDIKGTYWGVGAIWSSSPDFYNINYPGDSDSRNTRITYCTYGVMVYNNSYPEIGEPYPANGLSSIHDNTVDVSLNMYYSTVSNLDVVGIYWNGGNPSNAVFQVGSGSQIYSSPYITSDPWAAYPLPSMSQAPNPHETATAGVQASMQSSNGIKASIAAENQSSSIDPMSPGIDMRHQKKNREAKDYFISYLSKHPGDQRAYLELYNCTDDETRSDIINYFKTLPKEAAKEQKLLLPYLYLKDNNIAMAKKINDSIIAENPNTALSERATINNAYIALYNENNVDEAVKILNDLRQQPKLSAGTETPEGMGLSDLENAITSYAATLGNGDAYLSKLHKQAINNTTSLPKEYKLFDNYPNPFNPSTTIRYELPKNGFVTIKVYDILGREVATLVNENKTAGEYSVMFNAKNLSSGVYIYQLKAGNFISNKKLLLMK